MKNGRNLLYLLMVVIIVLGAIMIFKKVPKTSANEQSIISSPTATVLTDLQSEIQKAFVAKDATTLAQLCDEEIQFTHGETDDFFTREDVENYLKKFFIDFPTKSFAIVHSGSNKAKTGYYLIGDLESLNEKKLRVQISNNKQTIQSIEMNPQREF